VKVLRFLSVRYKHYRHIIFIYSRARPDFISDIYGSVPLLSNRRFHDRSARLRLPSIVMMTTMTRKRMPIEKSPRLEINLDHMKIDLAVEC